MANYLQGRGKPRVKIPLGFVIAAGIITMICQAVFCISIITTPTSTPIPTFDTNSLNEQIMQTAWSSYTQTMMALPTNTVLPTATLAPPTETSLPTLTSVPTATQTPLIVPTATLVILVIPTQPIQVGVCSCNGGLDCKDFSTHNQAQACCDYCRSQGFGDVHGLDGNDQDGLACESLP